MKKQELNTFVFVFFLFSTLMCSSLYKICKIFLSVEVMLVRKSSHISKADFERWLYVNVGKCASVVLILITWFMSDALKILKDL